MTTLLIHAPFSACVWRASLTNSPLLYKLLEAAAFSLRVLSRVINVQRVIDDADSFPAGLSHGENAWC